MRTNVDYKLIRGSQAFKDYKDYASELCSFDVSALSAEEQKAFWINIYNSLVVHAIVEELLPLQKATKTLHRLQLYATASYRVNQFVFSLNDIENGILRANRKSAVPMTAVPFLFNDPRRSFMLSLDPRIHFALNCGAQSCPPIAVYKAEQLDAQL